MDFCFKVHNIPEITINQLKKIDKYIIPDTISFDIINKAGSIDQAWIDLMKKPFKSLENYLEKTILKISNKYNEEVKALLVWRHNETVSKVAKKLNLKVIEMEFSSIRLPYYNQIVSYFQFSNKYSTNEFDKRYKNFLKEKNCELPILTRKEILTMFLSKENINYINQMDDPPIYEFGVGLGLEKDYESLSTNDISNKTLIDNISKLVNDKNLIFRCHPASKYNFKKNVNIDNSKNSIEFVLKCKRLASVLSNIGFEAMLYGRTSYIFGKMPYSKLSVKKIISSEEIVSLEKLNYIVFAYYAPYDLMLDKEYLDWRLSNPKESKIYLKHFNYYFKIKHIDVEILKYQGNERLKKFLISMGYHNVNKFLEYGVNSSFEELQKIKFDNLALKNELENKNLQITELNNKINDIITSKSWKITRPLRIISNKIDDRRNKNE